MTVNATGADKPRVFVLDASPLGAAREALRAGDSRISPAWAALKRAADDALSIGRFSVMDKSATPPSGNMPLCLRGDPGSIVERRPSGS